VGGVCTEQKNIFTISETPFGVNQIHFPCFGMREIERMIVTTNRIHSLQKASFYMSSVENFGLFLLVFSSKRDVFQKRDTLLTIPS
jgi:hypothetical protein